MYTGNRPNIVLGKRLSRNSVCLQTNAYQGYRARVGEPTVLPTLKPASKSVGKSKTPGPKRRQWA